MVIMLVSPLARPSHWSDYIYKFIVLYSEVCFVHYIVFFLFVFLFCLQLPYFCQRTPLHIAAKEGHDYTVECLVQQRADINSKDENGVCEE